MDECEAEVSKSEGLRHASVPSSAFFGCNAREYVDGFRAVIACCKCHVQQLLGNYILALQLAQQAVQLAHGASCTPYIPVVTGLAHVLKFLHEHDSPVLVEGMKLLRAYCRSLYCDPFDPSTLNNPDQLTDGDLYSIQILRSIPSPLSFSPLSLLRTSLVDEDSDDDSRSTAPCPTLSAYHYSTQGCGMLDEPVLPMDPLFVTLHDPMVVDELLEHHPPCMFEEGGSGGNVQGGQSGEGQLGEVEDFAVVV